MDAKEEMELRALYRDNGGKCYYHMNIKRFLTENEKPDSGHRQIIYGDKADELLL